MDAVSSVNPVFIKSRDIPDSFENRPSVIDICLAAEKTSGQGSVIGAQCIRGLWRIYPATKEGRTDLLIKGMHLRGVNIQVANANPFILRDDTGEEKPSTKLWVEDLPISVAETEVEFALKKLGCELRSSIRMEKARDKDNKLTRFITGRRFVFITVPSSPLDKEIKINNFPSKLYHKEQKQNKKTVICSRCLEPGHHVSKCEGDVVCRQCGKSGHKKGDRQCTLEGSEQEKREDKGKENPSTTTTMGAESNSHKAASSSSVQEDQPPASASTSGQRGRPPNRSPRNRSVTPKRPRSQQGASPRLDKCQRLEDSYSPARDDQGSRASSPPQSDSGGTGWN